MIRCVFVPRFVIRIVATAPFPNMGSPLRSTGTATDTPSKNWIVCRGEGPLVHVLPTATKQMEATARRQPTILALEVCVATLDPLGNRFSRTLGRFLSRQYVPAIQDPNESTDGEPDRHEVPHNTYWFGRLSSRSNHIPSDQKDPKNTRQVDKGNNHYLDDARSDLQVCSEGQGAAPFSNCSSNEVPRGTTGGRGWRSAVMTNSPDQC